MEFGFRFIPLLPERSSRCRIVGMCPSDDRRMGVTAELDDFSNPLARDCERASIL